jgi:hypothetical protein
MKLRSISMKNMVIYILSDVRVWKNRKEIIMCDKQCPVKSYKDRLIAEQAEEIKQLKALIEKLLDECDDGDEQ